MEYSIKKIIVQTVVVILISFIWMIVLGSMYDYFENRNSSQMVMYWLGGSFVFGYFYLKYAERKGYLSKL